MATFLLALAGWYPFLAVPVLAAAVSLLGAVGFCLAIIRHRRFRDSREATERLLKVIDESAQRCGGQVLLIRSCERPHDMPAGLDPLPVCLDSGEIWPLSGQERDDLDFYGAPVGLFGLLNRTSTTIAARRLADWLGNPCLSPERILSRQAAGRWPPEHPAARRLTAGYTTHRTAKRRYIGLRKGPVRS